MSGKGRRVHARGTRVRGGGIRVGSRGRGEQKSASRKEVPNENNLKLGNKLEGYLEKKKQKREVC